MPELPEVQTVVNHLKPILTDKQVTSCQILWDKTLYSKNFTFFNKSIKSRKIIDVYRLGKYIIFKLDKNYIAFHLRMTGYLYTSSNFKLKKHVRCYFQLSNKDYLFYEDIRKFGGFYYIKSLNIIYDKLGIDPLSDKFNSKWMIKKLSNKKRNIKGLLLDQSFISGLGNIYIDEILWHSRIYPNTLSNKLKKIDIKRLIKYTKSILNKSIDYHGTTIINFKFDNMKTGNYRKELKVYGRNKKQCFRCSNPIDKIKVFGRGTYFCNKCQKKSN